ncbi:undecaprenyl-phosphate glucose phosphotransferase [Paraburkholderia phymatum]|uniref:Undecaprenyl-phosphate glucose phosphotransferase n=1 Tax=Paraburkholderia phymatum TaxID=148447 RepID=A0ACC6TWZ5_9BURK
MLTPVTKAGDSLFIAGTAYVSHAAVFGRSSLADTDLLLAVLGFTLPFITFRATHVYRSHRGDSALRSAARVIAAWLTAQTLLVLLSRVADGTPLRNQWLLCWTGLAAVGLVLERYVLYALSSSLRSRGLRAIPIAIVAPNAANREILSRIAPQTHSAFVPVLIFDPSSSCDGVLGHVPVVHQMQSFKRLVVEAKLKEIWIIDSPFRPVSVEHLLEAFQHEFINLRILPVLDEDGSLEPSVGDYRGIRLLNLVAAPERGWKVVPKELFDRSFALVAVLILLPLFAVVAITIRCSSPGPVFFRQYRKGINGRVFSIYKFRTMYQRVDKPDAIVQARKNDARVTTIGRFLRRTSLDELPQFFNVLKGDMSVVGPRPHAVEHDEYYKDLVQHYMFRYRIKPGITGLAQVSGYRGETAQVEKMVGRVKLDIYYVQHWTLSLDIKIICLTILKGFVSGNAY